MRAAGRGLKFEICLYVWVVARNNPRLFPRSVRAYLDRQTGLRSGRVETESVG